MEEGSAAHSSIIAPTQRDWAQHEIDMGIMLLNSWTRSEDSINNN